MAKKYTSVAEALKAQSAPNTASQPLGRLWVKLVASKYSDFVPAPTMKEIGQLKQIDKRSEGRGEVILRWVIPNWVEFISAVQKQAGWKNVPNKPHIGFLLQNVGIAANMSAPKKQAEKYEAPKPVSVLPTVQLISQPQPAEVTMADLLKVLDET